MKKILLILLCIAILPVRANSQDTLYHVLDESKEEPSIKEWNVSHQKAVLSKNYIIEVTDNFARPTILYFYYHGINCRRVIDDPEIILFEYNDGSIDIIENYSRETDYAMWENEDFRYLHHHIELDENYRIKDYLIWSLVDTLRRQEYYQDMDLKDPNKDLETILLEEYHGVEACKEITIPYLEYLYAKDPGSTDFFNKRIDKGK